MIDAFQAFKFATAVKLHLTTDRYDVFESNGRVSGSRATFEKRNDRFLFDKLGRRFDTPRELIEYLVSNIAYGNKNVVYSSESDEYFDIWQKRKESRTYTFKQQLEYIAKHLESSNLTYDDLFKIEDNAPELLKLYVGGHIHLETMVILDDFENFLPTWEPMMLVWGDQLRVLKKIKKFVKYDKDKIELIYRQYKEELSEI